MEKLLDNHKYLSERKTSRRYSLMEKDGDLMLGCADSDFMIPEAMQEDLINIIKKGDLSYTYWTKQFLSAVNQWYKRKYGLTFTDDEFIDGSGVIHLMQVALDALTEVGDKVIIQPPVYGSFQDVVLWKKRKVVCNPLTYIAEDNRYVINFEDLEEKMKDPKAKVLIMCSPHNPVGRVWSFEETERICTLAQANNVFIISDEIWQDIVFKGHEHHPFLKGKNGVHHNVICLSSQGKTYNVGGAQIGYGVSYNKELIAKMKTIRWASIDYASTNYLSVNMMISGYTNPRNKEWNELYVLQIEKNFAKLKEALEAKTKILVANSECMYLVWLDFSDIVKDQAELKQRLLKQRIFGSFGDDFCTHSYDKCLRLVIAISDERLDELIRRLIAEFK